MRRAVIFNYNSIFVKNITETIQNYNALNPEKAFSVDIYNSKDCPLESMAGPADAIIHSGGNGVPVTEDLENAHRLYICHSHQWKARREGGEIARLGNFIKEVRSIEILEDDEILGKKGRMQIMEYHELGVVRPPRVAKVLATSKVRCGDGEEKEIIEALKYPDGSISVQGHPEEGAAEHIIHNFLKL